MRRATRSCCSPEVVILWSFFGTKTIDYLQVQQMMDWAIEPASGLLHANNKWLIVTIWGCPWTWCYHSTIPSLGESIRFRATCPWHNPIWTQQIRPCGISLLVRRTLIANSRYAPSKSSTLGIYYLYHNPHGFSLNRVTANPCCFSKSSFDNWIRATYLYS